MPPTPRVRFGSSRKNFSKIRPCSEGGIPSPRSETTKRTRAARRLDSHLDEAAVGRVLDRVVDEVDEHLAHLVRIRRDRRRARRHVQGELDPGREVRTRRRDHGPRQRTAVTALDRDVEHPGVEPARPEDVVDDPRQALRLARDDARAGPCAAPRRARRPCAAASSPRRRSRREAFGARARPSRRSRSSDARAPARPSGRGTRRRCRPRTGPRSARARARGRRRRRDSVCWRSPTCRSGQAASASEARVPTSVAAARPVIRSAAGFQSRTTSSAPIRKTPSPTNSSACAAWARASVSAYRRAFSIAIAARRASSSASDTSAGVWVRPESLKAKVTAPIGRLPSSSGTAR